MRHTDPVPYYDDKRAVLARLFGTDDIEIATTSIRVATTTYPIVNDVIVVLPEPIRPGANSVERSAEPVPPIAFDVQHTFGQEWSRFDKVLPEQQREFEQYFDIVDMKRLTGATVCDLGAGMGRWSSFIAPHCETVVLVDFSDAIHVARENLRSNAAAVFVMGDIANLPFADDCCDFAMCLGVLHTLPGDPIAAVRGMHRLSPDLLVYLMHALDNKPAYFRTILSGVSLVRVRLARLRNERARRFITALIAYTVYWPLIGVGRLGKAVHLDRYLPLAGANENKTTEGVKQVVYDRFFTPIEQRVTAHEILELKDLFSEVTLADSPPYWHFLCHR